MKNKRGITLIALILTIITLLILAGVTLSALVGENGIVTQAITASSKTKEETAKSEIELAWAARMTKFYEDLSTRKSK
ncbi:MAG: hypothetical protein IJ867_06830 [Clostridia bacterium]|nr:hypothetical protein [Clostridia bacterium]